MPSALGSTSPLACPPLDSVDAIRILDPVDLSSENSIVFPPSSIADTTPFTSSTASFPSASACISQSLSSVSMLSANYETSLSSNHPITSVESHDSVPVVNLAVSTPLVSFVAISPKSGSPSTSAPSLFSLSSPDSSTPAAVASSVSERQHPNHNLSSLSAEGASNTTSAEQSMFFYQTQGEKANIDRESFIEGSDSTSTPQKQRMSYITVKSLSSHDQQTDYFLLLAGRNRRSSVVHSSCSSVSSSSPYPSEEVNSFDIGTSASSSNSNVHSSLSISPTSSLSSSSKTVIHSTPLTSSFVVSSSSSAITSSFQHSYSTSEPSPSSSPSQTPSCSSCPSSVFSSPSQLSTPSFFTSIINTLSPNTYSPTTLHSNTSSSNASNNNNNNNNNSSIFESKEHSFPEEDQGVSVHTPHSSMVEDYHSYIQRKYSEKLALLQNEFIKELEKGELEIEESSARMKRADYAMQCLQIQLDVVEHYAATEGQTTPNTSPYIYACCFRGTSEQRRSLFSILSPLPAIEEEIPSPSDESSDSKPLLLQASRGDWIKVLKIDEKGWWSGENVSLAEKQKDERGGSSSSPIVGLIAGKNLQLSPYLGNLHHSVENRLNELRERLEGGIQREYEAKEKHSRFTRRVYDKEVQKAKALEIVAEAFRGPGRLDLLVFTDLAVARLSLQTRLQAMRKEMTSSIDHNCQLVLDCGKIEDRWEVAREQAEQDRARAEQAREGSLFAACERCDYNSAQHLVKNSSRWTSIRTRYVNAFDGPGLGALHLACLQGSWGVSLAQLLLKNGADPLLPDTTLGSSVPGDTPVHYAARSGEPSLLSLLLDSWVDPWGAAHASRKKAGGPQAARKELLNVPGKNERTPLCVAAEYGKEEVVTWLLEQGASFLLKDSFHNSPLHYCARSGHVSITKLLLDKGADPHGRNMDNETPLFLAVMNGHDSLVKFYVNSGVWLAKSDILRVKELAAANESVLFILRAAIESQLLEFQGFSSSPTLSDSLASFTPIASSGPFVSSSSTSIALPSASPSWSPASSFTNSCPPWPSSTMSSSLPLDSLPKHFAFSSASMPSSPLAASLFQISSPLSSLPESSSTPGVVSFSTSIFPFSPSEPLPHTRPCMPSSHSLSVESVGSDESDHTSISTKPRLSIGLPSPSPHSVVVSSTALTSSSSASLATPAPKSFLSWSSILEAPKSSDLLPEFVSSSNSQRSSLSSPPRFFKRTSPTDS